MQLTPIKIWSNRTLRTLFLFSFIIICVGGVFVQSSGIFPAEDCRFDKTVNYSRWNVCSCENLDGEGSTHIRCTHQPWNTIPTLPYDNRSMYSQNDTVYTIVALSITDSSLTFLGQDAFKHQSIQILDLTNNHLETVNVNAFRGLENKLYQLMLAQNNIVSIPSWALTYLYQLQHLHLQQNMISVIKPNTFDETQLNNLHYLHLDHNQISLLPRKSLYRLPLQVLTISNNRLNEIEKLALSSTIWYLDFKNNVLQEIPFLALRELKNLRTLDLEGNNITMIEFNDEVEFDKEMDLVLSNNRIQHVTDNAFGNFRKFNRLDLSYNQISTISGSAFSSISQMRQLDLSYNKILHIPMGTLHNVAKSLRALNLEENLIQTLPSALLPLRTLETLNINSNKLSSLENGVLDNLKPALNELRLAANRLNEVPTEALDGMAKLKHLDLSKNRIRTLHRLAFGRFDGTGTSLVKLNMAGNLIRNITDPGAFLYMSALAYLDLSYNRITEISDNAFERLEGLESLFLQNNQLSVFPKRALSKLHRLRFLLLDENPIGWLPESLLADFQHLEQLSISRTMVKTIDERIFHAGATQNLRSLSMAFCQIQLITSNAFCDLHTLEQLLLNNNKLTVIHQQTFASMRNLRKLDLSSNQINETAERAITDIPNLQQLSLAHNRIEKLNKATFVNLNNLETLDISYNYLRAFDFTFIAQSLINIKNLDLSHNKLITLDLNSAKRTLALLDLSYNNLQSIGKNTLNDFRQLHTLRVSHNELIEIQSNAFVMCGKLMILDLSHNHLRIIHKSTFANQKKFEQLVLSHNALISMDSEAFGVDNVQNLDLSCNELRRVPKHALNSIRNSLATLNLKGNRINTVESKDFDGMSNLTTLILSDNHIEAIEEAAFASMYKLIRLDLSHNPIVSWNPHAFQGLSSAITMLNLASTGLFSLPKIDNRGIRHLNISNNRIQELSSNDLSNHRKLITVDISYNNLRRIDANIFDNLVELKHLNICGNHIQRLTHSHLLNFYSLQTLNICDMSSMIYLPEPHSFYNLRHLRNLYLYGLPRIRTYNLSVILKHLPPLRTLSIEIREPRLSTQLYTADLRLLRRITIYGKQLMKIDVGSFAHLRGYKIELAIENTGIKTFPAAIFSTLNSVSFLSLSLRHNNLETLEPFGNTKPPVLNQYGTILHQLYLTGNPIICDCRIGWISKWIEYYDSTNIGEESLLNDVNCVDQAGGGKTLRDAYSKMSDESCETRSFHHTNHCANIKAVNTCILILIFFRFL